MNSIIRLSGIIILTATVLTFSNCSKEDITDTAETVAGVVFKAEMKADIDNEPWTGTLRNTEIIPGTKNDKLNFTGLSTDGKLINITTWKFEEGRYSGKIINQDSSSFFTAFYAEGIEDLSDSFKENAYALPKGQVNISDINLSEQRISGTFSFTLYKNNHQDSVVISNGSFKDMKY